MNVRWKSIAFGLLAAAAAGCGGGTVNESSSGNAGIAASPAVEVTGQVAEHGGNGSILVFAYADLATPEDPVGHEPASVDTVAANGEFSLSVPPAKTLTLVFLTDAANDGVVDAGDKVAILTGPDLADLQSGDRVRIADAHLDFTARRVTANTAVTRSRSPVAFTPTAVPAQ